MKSIGNISKYKKDDITNKLRKNFMIAMKDENFVKLVNRLKMDEDILIKHTSKLEGTVSELNNCKNCKGLSYCKNKVIGYISYPEKYENALIFSYIPCKYEKEKVKESSNITYFETPLVLRNAKMKDLFLDDKARVKVIKYVKTFIDDYKSGKKTKGLYLHGSFGSGKSYIINALLNELGKNGVKCVSVYFPNLLKTLKDGFGSNYEEKMKEIMNCDVLLIDDIGAENNTSWGRDEVLASILQHRMDNELHTFFTSNFNLEDLEEHLKITNKSTDNIKARRIIERIKKLTNELELIGKDRRN